MAGRLVGADPLIAIDIVPDRLALARELGASHVLDARDGELAARIRDIARDGADFTLETSGNEQALNDAILALASGGSCGMVIAPHLGHKYPFSPTEVFARAARLVGIIQGSAVPRVFLAKLLELHQRGRFPFDRMIKHYELAAINEAIADTQAGRTIKPVLDMPGG
jgi:aryl-alcohol dehydrogenase